MKVLVTGGAGFIGSNFIRYVIEKRPKWQITNFDKLTYAGNLANLEDIADNSSYKFVKGDISDPEQVHSVFREKYDSVVNFAAETHVDRSLYEPGLFLKTNVLGAQVLLNEAMEAGTERFLQISTDEVYGSLGQDEYSDERANLAPNSPYSASKASADLICRSYCRTYDMPVMIVRSTNNYGPYQFPEKLIPFFVTRALNDEDLPVYGDGLNIRDWIYVEDNCDAILTVLEKGKVGEIYNIGAGNEITNLEITKEILRTLDKPDSLIKFVEDRPGHDRRYALDTSKLRQNLNWHPRMDFTAGLSKTIRWYLDNRKWCESVQSGEYRRFYELHYRDKNR